MVRADGESPERKERWEELVRQRLGAVRAPEVLRARIHAMLAVELRFAH